MSTRIFAPNASIDGEGSRNHQALSIRAFGADFSLVGGDNAAGNGKTQAIAAGGGIAGAVHPVESVKQAA